MHREDIAQLTEECRLTGRFGPVELGASRMLVAFHLGAPDRMHPHPRQGTEPSLLIYGGVAFDFDDRGRLRKISRNADNGEIEVLTERIT